MNEQTPTTNLDELAERTGKSVFDLLQYADDYGLDTYNHDSCWFIDGTDSQVRRFNAQMTD